MATKRVLKPQILVVEDDTAVRRSMQLLLTAQGFSVRAHGSAAQALADPVARTADCLVADLVMAGMDGITLLGAMRSKEWSGSAILVSAHLDDENSKAAADAGFATVLHKPFAEGLLVEAVNRALDLDATI